VATGATVRPYNASDYAGVISLWNEVFPNEPPWNEPALIIRRKVGVQPDLFLVAISENSHVVGTVMAGYDGVRGWVHHLAVRPDSRRQGTGRALMLAAEAALSRLGCPKLNLQVRATNASTVSFYRALGYAVEDRMSLGKRLEQAD
jgi:ribosomal protein S18 acetylase RimI-like enzyme